MSIAVILAKLAVLCIYANTVYQIYKFKKNNRNVTIEFETFSSLEVAAGVGLALVCLVSVINPSSNLFTFCLCLLSSVIGFFHFRRMIIAGSDVVMIRGKAVRIRDIKSISNTMFALLLETNKQRYKIYVPLTGRNTLKEKIKDKIKRK